MARQGGKTRAARVVLISVAVAGASLGLAAPALAQAGPEPAAVASGPAAAAATVDQRSLGPVSTAAIGGVLAAGVLWVRARQRASVTA